MESMFIVDRLGTVNIGTSFRLAHTIGRNYVILYFTKVRDLIGTLV